MLARLLRYEAGVALTMLRVYKFGKVGCKKEMILKVIFYVVMASILLIQPALTEMAIDLNYSNTRLPPSLIISTIWVIAIVIYHQKRRANASPE